VVPQLPKDLDKSLEPFTVMISRCLQPNPEARPSAREIVDLLEAGPAPLPRSATAVLPKSGLTASGNALPLLPQYSFCNSYHTIQIAHMMGECVFYSRR
jgi:hypothetical protein